MEVDSKLNDQNENEKETTDTAVVWIDEEFEIRQADDSATPTPQEPVLFLIIV